MTTNVRSRRSAVRHGIDPWLGYITISLVIAGLFFVFSASFVRSVDTYNGDAFYFLKKQLISAIIGIGLLLACYWLGPNRLRWFTLPALMVTIGLLAATLVMGAEVEGTRRWISLGPFPLQPSEIAKLSLILFLAWFYTRPRLDIRDFWGGLLPGLAVVVLICGLVMAGHDLGTTSITLMTTLVILLIAGARIKHILALVALSVLAVCLLVFVFHYKEDRVRGFLGIGKDDESYLGRDYQARHSLIALGSGGPTGVGLARSREKYYYLPAAHTDFILAIVGEEAGLVGTGTIIVLFGLMAWRGHAIARRAKTPFTAVLAMGLASLIAIESLINIAVVTVSIPTTGTPLPFISYGGSSLAIKLAIVGILLSVHDRPNG